MTTIDGHGRLAWTVPNIVPTATGCGIVLIDDAGPDTLRSDFFTVTGLSLFRPLDHAALTKGAEATIRWETVKYSDVVISASFDEGKSYELISGRAITTDDAIWPTFVWTVPAGAGDRCLIRINRYQGPDEYFVAGPFALQ
jgi:hypothetical protein